MEKKKAIVLLSGGIDSSTVLAFAKSHGYELYALTFDYNQKHKRELDSARMVASSLRVTKHLIINLDLREIGGSALTSDMEVPKERIPDSGSQIQDKKNLLPGIGHRVSVPFGSSSIPVTYVPARNSIFLSFGLALAEVLESENLFIGANTVDYSGYPDCRPEYLRAFEDMANLATKISVEGRLRFKINAPLIYMKKSDIVKMGIELKLDYSLTWSCYDPQHSIAGITPCGRCDSCIFRRKAFQEVGIKDPLLK